jgi:Transposase
VITGTLDWRRRSAKAKAPIVAESLAPGVVISVVAHRLDLRPQQLFVWAAPGAAGAPLIAAAGPRGAGQTDTPPADSAVAPVIEVALGGAGPT